MNGYIIASISGFFAGLIIYSFIAISFPIIALGVFIVLGLLIAFWQREKFSRNKDRRKLFLAAWFLCFSVLGLIRFHISEEYFINSPLNNYEGKDVTLAGSIATELSEKAKDVTVLFETNLLQDGNETRKIPGDRVLLRLPSFAVISYGDKIIVSGKLEKVKNFEGSTFDYSSYLKKDGVEFQLIQPEITFVSKGGSAAKKILLSIKNMFARNLANILPEPDSSLVSGMIIAGKGSLPKDIQDMFIKAGIIHIVVLSGYNISIIISAILALSSRLGRRVRFFIVLIIVSSFVVMSGGSPPVIRAALMATIALSGKLFYRKLKQNRALLGTAFLMTLINPYILVFDPSFELSFLATFAIINIAPLFEGKLLFIPDKLSIRKTLIETLSVQVFVTPYLLYKMGMLSLVAPIVNLLVLPLVPPIMIIGFVGGILGSLYFLALPFGWIVHSIISLMLFVVELFTSLPFASISFHISFFVSLLLYGLIFIFFIKLKRRVAALE